MQHLDRVFTVLTMYPLTSFQIINLKNESRNSNLSYKEEKKTVELMVKKIETSLRKLLHIMAFKI